MKKKTLKTSFCGLNVQPIGRIKKKQKEKKKKLQKPRRKKRNQTKQKIVEWV